jgi:hypothetical protein
MRYAYGPTFDELLDGKWIENEKTKTLIWSDYVISVKQRAKSKWELNCWDKKRNYDLACSVEGGSWDYCLKWFIQNWYSDLWTKRFV